VTCDKAQSRLHAYADRALSDPQAEEMEHHLRSCAPCREQYAALERLAGAMQAFTIPEVPDGLASRIVARARLQQPAAKRIYWHRLEGWVAMPAPMRAAAIFVLLVGLGAGTLLGLATSGTSKTPIAVANAGADPATAMHLDYLSSTPGGSTADAYLALASEGGR
jgi:anti-sigma factor RsiW